MNALSQQATEHNTRVKTFISIAQTHQTNRKKILHSHINAWLFKAVLDDKGAVQSLPLLVDEK